MKHTEPLRMNYEFARVYKRGRFLAGSLVVVHYLRRKGPGGTNRLGVTVSKSVSGSVRRNRVKRLLRESYRLQEDLLDTGYDIIITGRQAEPALTFAQVDREVGRLLRRAGIRRQPAAPGQATEPAQVLAQGQAAAPAQASVQDRASMPEAARLQVRPDRNPEDDACLPES